MVCALIQPSEAIFLRMGNSLTCEKALHRSGQLLQLRAAPVPCAFRRAFRGAWLPLDFEI